MILALAVFVDIPLGALLFFRSVRRALGHAHLHVVVPVYEHAFTYHERGLVAFSRLVVLGAIAAVVLAVYAALSQLYVWLR